MPEALAAVVRVVVSEVVVVAAVWVVVWVLVASEALAAVVE